MAVVALTPTRGRPESFGLLRRWAGHQTTPIDAWVVALDGDDSGYDLAGCDVARTPASPGCSLSNNIRAGADALARLGLGRADVVLILEDDDYYAPGYASTMAPLVLDRGLAGSWRSRFYSVARRRGRVLEFLDQHGTRSPSPRFSCLCQTAIRGDLAARLLREAAGRDHAVDRRLWGCGVRRIPPGHLDDLQHLHVGVKGMPTAPGAEGYSTDHRGNVAGQADPTFALARSWGLPADPYRRFYRPRKHKAPSDAQVGL